MKVRNIVRKAASVVAGSTMVGATLMGALAANLADYPGNMIEDGLFNGKIVVGERAATADVIGSIDIAASLQASSTVEVPIPGASGEVGLSGDAFRLDRGSDRIELRESIGDVVDTITGSDLAGLKSGRLSTSEGTTDFHQYIRLKDGGNLQNMTVNFVENDDDVMAPFLVVDTDLAFIEWEIQFPEGLETEIETNGDLDDLEDKTFNILGTDFTVVRATLTSGDNFEVTLMGGSVADTLREGETRVYSIDGVDYEVTLVFVSDPNSGTVESKFSVNGELTQALEEGDTDTLSGGLQIGVRDILVNAREGVASFFLGADKVVLTDNTVTASSSSFDGTIEINNENIAEGDVQVTGQNTSSTTKFEITSIKYKLSMDAADGTTAFIPAGHGIKEFMDKPESLISDSLDIRFEGLTNEETTDVEITAKSDDEYRLTFTNIQGQTYTFPLLSNSGGVFKFGDEDDDLVFLEGAAITSTNIGRQDYFVVSNDRGTIASGEPDKSVTNVLRYEDYDNSDAPASGVLEFEDLATGSTVNVAVTSTGTGSLVIGGHSYAVNVSNVSLDAPTLSVDLNGDGGYGDEVLLTAWGGLVIDMWGRSTYDTNNTDNIVISAPNASMVGNGAALTTATVTNTSQTVTSGSFDVLFNATVLAKNFDTSGSGHESFWWSISQAASNRIDLSFSSSNYFGPLRNGAGGVSDVDGFQFRENEEDDDHTIGMTDWGIFIDLYNPTSSNDPDELVLSVPEQQLFGQVFVTLGSVETTQGPGGSATQVNPIAVGLAVLDRDAPAVGSENLIVVGGPCANTVAAELLGNPENCAEGFEPGKAMIRTWDRGSTVAILVAGYEATETLGASRVLAQHGDYGLSGSEVEVVVADLNSITVQAPSAAAPADDMAEE